MELNQSRKTQDALQTQYEESKGIIERLMRKTQAKDNENKRLHNLIQESHIEINRLTEEQYLIKVQ